MMVEVYQIPLSESLRHFSDKFLFDYMQQFRENGDEAALNIAIEEYATRKKMREQIGGKYIEFREDLHEILSKNEDGTFNIINTRADEDMLAYITETVEIDGITNKGRENSDSEGEKICNSTSDAKGEEIQSSTSERRVFNSLWRRFLSCFSWHSKR